MVELSSDSVQFWEFDNNYNGKIEDFCLLFVTGIYGSISFLTSNSWFKNSLHLEMQVEITKENRFVLRKSVFMMITDLSKN